MKIQSGDNIIVIAGKDKGKTGKVLRAFPKKNKVIVEGINMVKKHVRARGQGEPGGIIDTTMPINVSNVMIQHPKTKKGVRVGYKVEAGKKTRVTKGKDGGVKI